MNKWFYSATCKGLLLILAHLCIVVSVVSFVWVGTSAGLRYLIPFEKVQSHYESTAQFENRMKTMSALIGNKGVVLAKQFDSVESISRHAKDLYTDELDAYESTLNMILRDALEAKHDLMLLRRNIGRCSQ